MTSLGALVRAHSGYFAGRQAMLEVSDRWFQTAPQELFEYVADGRLEADVRAALDAGVIEVFRVERDAARGYTRYEWVVAPGLRA